MNKKSTVYILIAAVLLIWSFIAYKIYNVVSEPELSESNKYKINAAKANNQSDTFTLLLNYSDPFTKRNYVPTEQSYTNSYTGNRISFNINKPIASNIDATSNTLLSVKYFGLIKTEQKKTGMITINGKSIIVREGQKLDSIKIISLSKKEILFKDFYNKLYTIKIN